MLEDKLEQDIKKALLSGDSTRANTLRVLKATLLNEKIRSGKREQGLSDDEVIAILSKEVKQRQESADLYTKGGNQAKADAEMQEKTVIEEYLPERMSEEMVAEIVNEVIKQIGAESQSAMGQVIGAVRKRIGPAADGALIARLVKEKLS
jgi:uncharacterized protein YqeY